jgi:chorismate-pyruvate lyase
MTDRREVILEQERIDNGMTDRREVILKLCKNYNQREVILENGKELQPQGGNPGTGKNYNQREVILM